MSEVGRGEPFAIDLAATFRAAVGGSDSHHRGTGQHSHGRDPSAGPQDVGPKATQATTQVDSPQTPRVIDILRSYTPSLLTRVQLASQAKSVLSRILLCRTPTLKGHLYECPECHSQCNVYNSCVDRHCPQCGGARRANWLEKTEQLVLPTVNYFQVVFTLPAQLSALILGNRCALYDLLFHSAWRALDETLRDAGQFQPAAQLVLHT